MTNKNDTMKAVSPSLSRVVKSQKIAVTTNTTKVFNERMVPNTSRGFSFAENKLAFFESVDFGLLGGNAVQQNAGAVEILRKNRKYLDTAAGMGRPDRNICKEDLMAAMENPATSPELKAACMYMLENPSAFKKLDTALSGGLGDDKIGFNDLDYVHVVQTLQKNRSYLDTAAGNGSPDRLIEKEDLIAATKNPATSPELKEACTYLLEHPYEFLRLETTRYGDPGDNMIDFDDLDATGFAGCDARGFRRDFDSKNFVDAAASIDNLDKLIGKEDLIAVMNNPDISSELQEACKHLLAHAGDMGKLATTQPGSQSPEDKKSCSPTAGSSDSNKFIGLERLRAAMDNPASSPELKKACKYLLEHPHEYCKIVTPQHDGSKNNKNRSSGLVTRTMKAHLSWSKF